MEEILFQRPQLEHRELIESYFKKYPSRICERTFVNEYLWCRFYQVTFAIVNDTLVFRSGEAGSFSFPAGEAQKVRETIVLLQEYAEERGFPFLLYNVTTEFFEQLEAWFPNRFEIFYERDYADYVYETEKLASLSGKKLHAKRNHINKFKATYPNWTYEAMSAENVEECFQMALKWRKENGCEDDEEKNAEMCVTLNSLRLFEELDLKGGILRIDGDIVAFTIGEEVSPDTFVVHIEKAFGDIQGAYPMINQQFVQHACIDYQYVNREDDTGAEGLRKAKLSYYPAFLVEKGVVKEKVQ
ncbi:MAG: phosphatidylglycerol lysyltransferase domain-containing protein [Faecalimonas sp.]|nr:phosphatidylglycerol lysyltransferase domain-containing protein [Faecalimonas sp.]